jgi:hypothetical protein
VRACVMVAALGISGCATADSGQHDIAAAQLVVSQIEVLLTFLGVCGAVVAFVIGLGHYKRAEQWKRAEFIASEMKEFFASPRVDVALTLVDWGGRNVRLLGLVNPNDVTLTYVTREMQCWALLPHQVVNRARGSDVESERAGAEAAFSPEHGLIRDCYDSLLDGFERFDSYLESEFVTLPELRPYISYWVKDIAAPASDPMDAAWTACLFVYIQAYGYQGVQNLFGRFGYQIGTDQPLFQRFLAGTPHALQALLKESLAVNSR